jgi:hypothetical protein
VVGAASFSSSSSRVVGIAWAFKNSSVNLCILRACSRRHVNVTLFSNLGSLLNASVLSSRGSLRFAFNSYPKRVLGDAWIKAFLEVIVALRGVLGVLAETAMASIATGSGHVFSCTIDGGKAAAVGMTEREGVSQADKAAILILFFYSPYILTLIALFF